MYAKNNLSSLNKLHTNALMKSQPPQTPKMKPLSQIENSLQKLKARKKKSKSKSRSKQNTPQSDKSIKRRNSISNQKNSIYFQKFIEKSGQSVPLPNQKRILTRLNEQVNSVVSSYENISSKTPSQISLNSRQLTDSNVTSCVNSEYQLPINSQLSQKSVKFSDKNIQFNMSRLNTKKNSQKIEIRQKTPSILKKKLSQNSVNSQRSTSSRSINKVSRTKQMIEIQNISANKMIKLKHEALFKKYEELNKKFIKTQIKNYQKLEKYTDDIFPPQNSSLFSYSIHNKVQRPKNIQWKRIPQLYPKQNLVVLRQQNVKSLIKITKKDNKQFSLTENYLITSFNCIRQNKKLLQRMFQYRAINLFGVYLIKIFQQNSWKYVVIDDFIPVYFDQPSQNYYPVSINVQKAEGNTCDIIEIWPYLLQKAYASYYSKYQALKYGNQINFLQELTSVPSHQVKISKLNFENKQHLQIQNILRQERGIVLGQKIVDQISTFFCILPDLNSITKKAQGFCTYLTPQKNFKPIKERLQTFLTTLTKIYVYQFNMPSNISLSFLCLEHKKSTQGSFRGKKQSLTKEDSSQISLRCFNISEFTKSILVVKQKDSKFYFQSKVQYNYIWIRSIILMKQNSGEYRWIDGKYSNKKSLTFFITLQPGQYYLLLIPQYSASNKYDISISLYTEIGQTSIQKRLYPKTQQIFQKGCADIAQRQGCMNQINKYICAYNYVSQQTGLVIQNINNQRQNGPVTVMRSINGLKCQVSLIPVNKQFYFNTSSQYDNEAVKKMKKTIEVDIEASKHYTVVLKTVGGIDHKFFDSFDFGS